MLRISSIVNREMLTDIQDTFNDLMNVSVAIYEFDGEAALDITLPDYCNPDDSNNFEGEEAVIAKSCVGTKTCREIANEAIKESRTLELRCPSGVNIYASPIFLDTKVIGCILARLENDGSSKDPKADIPAECQRQSRKEHGQSEIAYETELVKGLVDSYALRVSKLIRLKLEDIEKEQEILRQKNNIEELLQTKKALADEYESILKSINEGVTIVDSNGVITKINDAGGTLLGNKLGKSLSGLDMSRADHSRMEFLHVNDKTMMPDERPIMRALKGETFSDYEVKVKIKSTDGYIEKYLVFSGAPLKNESGKTIGAVDIFRDISDKIENERLKDDLFKQVNEQKRIAQEKSTHLETILNNMSEAVIFIDKSENMTPINDVAKHIYGIQSWPISVSKFREIFNMRTVEGNDITKGKYAVEEILVGKNVANLERLLTHPDNGEEFYINTSGSPIYDEEGVLVGGVLVIREITERVLMRKQQEELMQAKEEFFTIISHELRIPITVINSAIQMLFSENYKGELTAKSASLIQKIRQNTYRLQKLTNNVLDITKAGANYLHINPVCVDIVKLSKQIKNSVALHARNRGIRVGFYSDKAKIIANIDCEKFERILLNLLSNAIKYTSKGGRIDIIIVEQGDHIKLTVKDTGVGIPEDKLGKIFDKFIQVDNTLTRAAEGTGIGLSLVKILVEKMQGTIEAKSKMGRGAEFILTLPNYCIEDYNEIYDVEEDFHEKVNVEFSDII